MHAHQRVHTHWRVCVGITRQFKTAYGMAIGNPFTPITVLGTVWFCKATDGAHPRSVFFSILNKAPNQCFFFFFFVEER